MLFVLVWAKKMCSSDLTRVPCQTHTLIAHYICKMVLCHRWGVWWIRHFFRDHSLIQWLSSTKMVPALSICPWNNLLFLVELSCWHIVTSIFVILISWRIWECASRLLLLLITQLLSYHIARWASLDSTIVVFAQTFGINTAPFHLVVVSLLVAWRVLLVQA